MLQPTFWYRKLYFYFQKKETMFERDETVVLRAHQQALLSYSYEPCRSVTI